MGSDIGDLFERRESELGTHLRGQIIAIDAYNTIYQFLRGLKLVFVFDGVPPDFKAATIEKRREIRDTAEREWKEALAAGREDAFKYAQATSRLHPEMVADAKSLLTSMGIPVVDAASEAMSGSLDRRITIHCSLALPRL